MLIDQTALPSNLEQYQYVDLRTTLSEHHEFFIDVLDPNLRSTGSDSEDDVPIPPEILRDPQQVKAFVRDRIRSASQQLKSSLTAEFGEFAGLW